jgi:hypothetical protein
MLTPSFTADSSLYRGDRTYAGAGLSTGQSSNRVVPQQSWNLESTCGACVCDAGKCCYQSAGECACYTCAAVTVAPNRGFLIQ